jgi:hypothetical protein
MFDSNTAVMSKLHEDKTTQESEKFVILWKNILIWFSGIIVSAIPLFVAPLVKLGVVENYNAWFNDIFNNGEVLIIAVCLAVPVIFHSFTGEQQKWSLIFGFSFFLFIIICIFVYCTVTGITEFARLTESEKQPSYRLGKINCAMLVIMFMLGLVSFIVPRGGNKSWKPY